ncbi:hypothetical protein BDF21DRAFT_489380 [Thamnidium elegans]|uniref:Uncharacterized protein n=1 Tax=Thamnidium elegans TaxID=101142 RepID=A0A8H7VSR5_9FUNG|nr:hypothetical protein INT48_007063 [Thamnidium elegans]KAI8095940.1 hypothetical protein BDF21DRAFT_489380 [Thamnidium elegans]
MKLALSTVFLFVTLVAFVSAAPHKGESEGEPEGEFCILSIVPCPEECPETCIYPDLPCPFQYEPTCPS